MRAVFASYVVYARSDTGVGSGAVGRFRFGCSTGGRLPVQLRVKASEYVRSHAGSRFPLGEQIARPVREPDKGENDAEDHNHAEDDNDDEPDGSSPHRFDFHILGTGEVNGVFVVHRMPGFTGSLRRLCHHATLLNRCPVNDKSGLLVSVDTVCLLGDTVDDEQHDDDDGGGSPDVPEGPTEGRVAVMMRSAAVRFRSACASARRVR